MHANEAALRNELCTVAHRIHSGGFISGTDGNISARLENDRFLISASATSLGLLTPDDLVVVDAQGETPDAASRPSSERWMHLAAYANRPKIDAIIHAHPPTVVAMTIAGVDMPSDVLPESLIAFGAVPTAEYATPGTKDGASVVGDLVRNHDAIILDRHGSLTLGQSAWVALGRLEQLEHAARIITIARQLGELRSLSATEVRRLLELRNAYHAPA